ncbi:hypothetical protein ACUN7V_15505 [Quadrisphaera oryzae]|uniref:hypothetical protein n=1 Tax=Quadrisphaera TaxID=317661 RepID=UPI001648E792|nr:hypothetical protein [Quadrisphaera sp. RL12-1S]MBC3760617.1 hypothetical protein [Quadrisphaera sp. RL12-1S]
MVHDDTMNALLSEFSERVLTSSTFTALSADDAGAVRAALTSEPLPWHQATTGMVAYAVGGESLHEQTAHGLDPLVIQTRHAMDSSDFEPVAAIFIREVLKAQRP